jgi:hypothetical protein
MARISSLDLFGRPHFEQLRGTETNDYAFRDHCGIVEVVLNLSVWFAIHAFFPRCAAIDCFPFRHRRSCLYRNATSEWDVMPCRGCNRNSRPYLQLLLSYQHIHCRSSVKKNSTTLRLLRTIAHPTELEQISACHKQKRITLPERYGSADLRYCCAADRVPAAFSHWRADARAAVRKRSLPV